MDFPKFGKFLNDRAFIDGKGCIWPAYAYKMLKEGNSPEAAEFSGENNVTPEQKLLDARVAEFRPTEEQPRCIYVDKIDNGQKITHTGDVWPETATDSEQVSKGDTWMDFTKDSDKSAG